MEEAGSYPTVSRSRAHRAASLAIFSSIVLVVWWAVFHLTFDDASALFRDRWVIIPLAFVAAAFANATAVGGGFVFVPLFIFGYGLPATAALKLSLATQAFGMSSGALGWSKRFIATKPLVIGSLFGVLGMFLGTFPIVVSGAMIKQAFGWVSLFIFAVVMCEIIFGDQSHETQVGRMGLVKGGCYALVCFLGGAITAWTAIGIGEVVALYLLFVYRLRIETAIGTGVAVLAVSSIAGFGFHINLGGIPWDYLIFTIPGVIIGGRFGAKFGKLVESIMVKRLHLFGTSPTAAHSPLKWLFAVVILLDGIMMLWQFYRNS